MSEAIVAGLPVIATAIDGCMGVLGAEYPGFFPVGHEDELTDMLVRAEQDSVYLSSLEIALAGMAPQLTRQVERQRWAQLLEELDGDDSG